MMSGASEALLRGRSFFVAPVGVGVMRMTIFTTNINKNGGFVVKSPEQGADFFLCDKSCETEALQSAKVRELWKKCGGTKELKSLDWMSDILKQKHWIEAEDENANHTLSLELENTLLTPSTNADAQGSATGSWPLSSKRPFGHMQDEQPTSSDSKRHSKTGQSTMAADVEGNAPSEGAGGGGGAHHETEGGELPMVGKYIANDQRPPPIGVVQGGFEWALVRIQEQPLKHANVVLMRDDKCLVIYDAYPKARYHLLVLPTEPIMSISDLRPHHLPLIKHMHHVAAHVIASIRKADVSRNGGEGVRVGGKDGGETFRIGYHAVPSLKLLHLHVISTDFDSPCLKNKKHWNSFQPPFFLDSLHVQQTLAATGKVDVDKERAEEWLKAPLLSHRTSETLKNIPTLKEHLRKCAAPVKLGVPY